MSIRFFSRPALWGTMLLATTAAVVYKYYESLSDRPQAFSQELAPISQQKIALTALGRILPQGEIINVSSSFSLEKEKVASLLVQPGEEVKKGQLIAILDNRDRLSAALNQAQEEVKLANAKLTKLKAQESSQTKIEAQNYTIARLEAKIKELEAASQINISQLKAELLNAEIEYQRYENLYQQEAVAAKERDRRKLDLETLRSRLDKAYADTNTTLTIFTEQLEEAKATLNRIVVMHPIELQIAEAEVNHALSGVRKAQDNLEMSHIRSPQTGKVLKIQVQPGEPIGDQGIIELAQTEQMQVIAQVPHTNIDQVRIGQEVIISSEVFWEELHGRVTHIDSSNIFGKANNSNTDRKIIEVKIVLDAKDSQKVKDFVNLQVKVGFHP
jgi:HlyD family secretion protein